MKSMKVKLTFFEEVLGTAASDPEIHKEFIAGKGLSEAKKQYEKYKANGGIDEEALKKLEENIKKLESKTDETKREEIEAISSDEDEPQGKTVFAKMDDGTPFLWDYHIRGFFKSAAQAGGYVGGKKKLTAYKKKIDLLVFVDERKIPLTLPEDKGIGNCQRPLRGQTAQGERIALANSESVPAGTTCEFTVTVLEDNLMSFVRDWLDYGKYNGIGQWRNSGKGRFEWEEITE